jgi:hypothetical protein
VADGLDEGRLAQFAAETPDENLDELGVVFVFAFPNMRTEFVTCESATGLAHQEAQEGKFPGGKLNALPLTDGFAPVEVEAEIACLQERLRLGRETTPESTDSGHQFIQREGLCEIIIRPELKAAHTILHIGTCAQHQDTGGDVRCPDLTEDAPAIAVREFDIEKKEIEIPGFGSLESGFSVVSHFSLVPSLFERRSNMLGELGFIVDEKNAHRERF